MTTNVPEFMVERLAKGEFAPDVAAEVRIGLGDNADARLQAIATDDAATLAALPPAEVAAEVRRRLAIGDRRSASSAGRWWIPSLALAATAAIAWFASRPTSPGVGVSVHDDGVAVRVDGEQIRTKGDPQLAIDQVSGAGTRRLRDGDEVATGDRLQVRYRAAGRTSGVIVSIDGAGATTLHFPGHRDASPQLRPGDLVALDHSYELDDAPGFERFFFVTVPADEVLDIDTVVRAAETLAAGVAAHKGALVLPQGYEQRSLELRKKPR